MCIRDRNNVGENFRVYVWIILCITLGVVVDEFGFWTPFWFKGLITLIVIVIFGMVITLILFDRIPKLFGINVLDKEDYSGVYSQVSNSTRLNKLKEKLTQSSSKYDDLKQDINLSKIQLSNLNSINRYVVKYDKDDNGLLDIAETTNIDKLLSKHQKKIREIEKAENTSFIPDLVKVNNYLNDYQNNLVEEFKIISSDSNSVDTDVDSNTKNFTEDFEMYKVLISSLVLMIDSIVKDNHIIYYKLKESMDKYGVFDSNFQKNQIALMKENNQATSKLIHETISSRSAIIESLNDIDVSIGGVQDELWWSSR